MYAMYLFLMLISVTSGDYLMTLIVLVLGKGSIKKKKIWNFPDLVGGWVWKSPFSRSKKIKKYLI